MEGNLYFLSSADPNVVNKAGFTPLLLAVSRNQKQALKNSISWNKNLAKIISTYNNPNIKKHFFDLSASNKITGMGLLHYACLFPSLTMIMDLLVERAISPIQLDNAMRIPSSLIPLSHLTSKKSVLVYELERVFKRIYPAVIDRLGLDTSPKRVTARPKVESAVANNIFSSNSASNRQQLVKSEKILKTENSHSPSPNQLGINFNLDIDRQASFYSRRVKEETSLVNNPGMEDYESCSEDCETNRRIPREFPSKLNLAYITRSSVPSQMKRELTSRQNVKISLQPKTLLLKNGSHENLQHKNLALSHSNTNKSAYANVIKSINASSSGLELKRQGSLQKNKSGAIVLVRPPLNAFLPRPSPAVGMQAKDKLLAGLISKIKIELECLLNYAGDFFIALDQTPISELSLRQVARTVNLQLRNCIKAVKNYEIIVGKRLDFSGTPESLRIFQDGWDKISKVNYLLLQHTLSLEVLSQTLCLQLFFATIMRNMECYKPTFKNRIRNFLESIAKAVQSFRSRESLDRLMSFAKQMHQLCIRSDTLKVVKNVNIAMKEVKDRMLSFKSPSGTAKSSTKIKQVEVEKISNHPG